MAKNIHIMPREGRWVVKVEGNSRISSDHRTQGAAINAGIPKAKAEKSDVVIHGRDNKIRDRDSYGNDPFPPKDMRH